MHGSDVDDAAAAPGALHVRDAGLCRQERAVEVDRQHPLPLGKGKLSIGCTIWMPALLTRTSTPPHIATTRATPFADLRLVRDVHRDCRSRCRRRLRFRQPSGAPLRSAGRRRQPCRLRERSARRLPYRCRSRRRSRCRPCSRSFIGRPLLGRLSPVSWWREAHCVHGIRVHRAAPAAARSKRSPSPRCEGIASACAPLTYLKMRWRIDFIVFDPPVHARSVAYVQFAVDSPEGPGDLAAGVCLARSGANRIAASR